jgi:hypothetical protein
MSSPLNLPDGVKAWQLGRRENHDTLHKVLSKYVFGEFFVTSENKEQELRAVRDGVDCSGSNALLKNLLQDGDHGAQIRLLLSLGIDPDKPIYSFRPSHWTVLWGRQSCAKALAPCRPDLKAVNDCGKTPRTTDVSTSVMIRRLVIWV